MWYLLSFFLFSSFPIFLFAMEKELTHPALKEQAYRDMASLYWKEIFDKYSPSECKSNESCIHTNIIDAFKKQLKVLNNAKATKKRTFLYNLYSNLQKPPRYSKLKFPSGQPYCQQQFTIFLHYIFEHSQQKNLKCYSEDRDRYLSEKSKKTMKKLSHKTWTEKLIQNYSQEEEKEALLVEAHEFIKALVSQAPQEVYVVMDRN